MQTHPTGGITDNHWYYEQAPGEQRGPVGIDELRSLAHGGTVGSATLVWNPGLSNWIPAGQVTGLLNAPPSTAEQPSAPREPLPVLQLKPRRGPFVFPRILAGLAASVVLAAVACGFLAAFEQSPWGGAAVFATIVAITIVASSTAYRKERYEIHDTRVICHRGGLASDQTTELEIRNITHVKLRLPWLRFKFSRAGDVFIQTGGNSEPVVLRSVHEPEEIYAGLQQRMKANGYDLTRSQLVHEERPAVIGVLAECAGVILIALVFGLNAVSAILEGLQATPSDTLGPVALGFTGLIALGAVSYVMVRFLDYRRRTYRVYNDVVDYDEGFLTRHRAFIPYENIADANTKRTFFDQIFGLYDVLVSCQGSGSEIKFRRLAGGVAISNAIDHLVEVARQKKKPLVRSPDNGSAVPTRRREPEAVTLDESLVCDLRMDTLRTLLPLLILLPLVPIWLAAMIQAGIRIACTRYFVRPGSVRHSYHFLHVDDREFAFGKITGMVVKQNLWDRMFGTLSVTFWSIGSGQPLEFSNIKEDHLNLPALMRQAGIPAASPSPCVIMPAFGLWTWLRAHLMLAPLPALFAAGVVTAAVQADERFYWLLILPVAATAIAWTSGSLRYSRQRLRFHEHHIEAEQGIVARKRYFVRYGNVKRTRFTRYPGGNEGDLQILVAGEEEVGPATTRQKKLNQHRFLRQCSFTSRFLPDIRDQATLLDEILAGRADPAPGATVGEPEEILIESTRAAGNSLLKLVLVSVIAAPLAVLLPLTVPIAAIRAKRCRYRVSSTRVVKSWGLVFRSETSILLDRIDSLQRNQGPLNKLFGNGDVSIMTAGSGKPDLVLMESPAHQELYRIIRERSRQDS